MQIERLSVHRFRNLGTQTVDFPSRVTILTGKNGQGKTSLIEAIYLLAQAKSFRTASSRELVQWHSTAIESDKRSVIEADVRSAIGLSTVRYEIENGRRSIQINGNRIDNARQFFGTVKAVEFTPDDLQLIKGGPVERRRYLDRILSMSDPVYVETLVHYQRALKQRNKILAAPGSGSSAELAIKLESWSRLLVEYGRVLSDKRQHFVKELTPRVIALYESIARSSGLEGGERVSLQLTGHFFEDGVVRSADQLLLEYRSRVAKDIERGCTGFGPQRDDLQLIFDTDSWSRSAGAAASQGQTRTLALSLKIAAVEYLQAVAEEPPILLLDDVESELDAGRREALKELIARIESQVIITTTDGAVYHQGWFENPYYIEISGGTIRRRNE